MRVTRIPAQCLVVAVAAWLSTAVGGGSASAQSYYWHEGSPNPPKASYVYRYTYNQPCGTLHKYLTTNLTPGADTVMHLTIGTNEVTWNDNFGSGSQISYYAACSSGSQTVTLWVRAASNASGGDPALGYTYTFRHERVSSPAAVIYTKNNVKLGGWLLAPGGTLNTAVNDTVETVLVNNGAPATMLLLFYWDTSETPHHYRLYKWNQSAGVGLGSKLGGTNYGNELWVVATPAEGTREGRVRVVRNDKHYGDDDGDNLGNGLELEVCTCKGAGVFYCSASSSFYTCNATATQSPRDTDSDGLQDDLELIGKEADSNGPPLYLPWWGANPRRRDIFIEVDRVATGAWMDQDTAIAAGRPFAELQITNPDGSIGVFTHFDIGGAGCSDEDGTGPAEPPIGGGFNVGSDVDGITRFCGNFGGADTLAVAPSLNCAQDMLAVAANRHGVFRWMVRGVGHGQTRGAGPRCAYIGNNVDAVAVVAHELGHQIGLWHNGDRENMNQTPTYQSLMNYAYSEDFYVLDNGVIRGRPRFSHGTLASWPLDPNNLSETSDFGGTAPLHFLLEGLSTYDFDSDTDFPRRIDWNRDGWWDQSVRAHVVGPPNKRNYGGSEMPTQFNQQNLPLLNVSGTTVGAAYSSASGYSYVIANNAADKKFYYTRRTSGSWLNWALLPSSPTFAETSSPAVAAYHVLELIVFGSGPGGQVQYARFSVNATLEDGWDLLTMPQNRQFYQVGVVSTPTRLYVVATDVGNALGEVWFGWFEGITWNGFARVEIAGIPGLVRRLARTTAESCNARVSTWSRREDIHVCPQSQ